MAQLRAAPQVVSVSPTAAPPFLGSNVWMIKIVAAGQSESAAKANPFFGYDLVGAEFFRTLDVPILAGRAFTDADREDAPPVAIISEGVARRLWPNENAVGKRFHEPGKSDSLITIVGVVPDLHLREYRDATPMVFRPYRQVYAQGYFVVKTRGAPASASRAVRQAVSDAGVGATFVNAESLDELIVPQLAAPRFETLLLSLFACGALLLAAIGLYGITASAVSQRTRELGIRLALGATPGEVRGMVLRGAMGLAVAGAAVGLAAALAALRLVRSMLFDITPYDPLTLALVTLLLLLIAALAAYAPARKATMIDPSRALRAE
jgi:predicted permease